MVWHLRRFTDFPVAEWVLRFENRGVCDTLLIPRLRQLMVTSGIEIGRGAHGLGRGQANV